MAGAIAEVVAGAVSGLADIGFKAYDVWNQNRNYDYQKALQQQIFNREDTAVQRRMADLKAAGLNPFMASGQSANSGTVVSTTPPQLGNFNSLGSALDMAMAVEQIRQMKEQTKQMENDSDVSSINRRMAQLQYLFETGSITADDVIKEYGRQARSMPMFQMFMNNVNAQKNSADMLQKQNDWFVADQINDYFKTAGSLFNYGGNFYNNYQKYHK